MSLGLGVFLGLVSCGLVYFQVRTGKKVFKWIGLCIASIFVVLFIWWLVVQIDNYIDGRPKVITELAGVKLGEPLADVEFRLGKFNQGANEWQQILTNKNLSMKILDGKVDAIIYTSTTSSLAKNFNLN